MLTNALPDDATEQYEDRTGLVRAAALAALEDSWEDLDAPLTETDWCVVPIAHRLATSTGGVITVGRIRRCDVVLRYEAVSKQHAEFLLDARGVSALRDCRSTHGTFVNGARIAAEQSLPIRIGDRLSFGPVEFEWLDANTVRQILRSL